jgi:flagellar protein FliS
LSSKLIQLLTAFNFFPAFNFLGAAPIRASVSIFRDYLETEVLSADRARLVEILYRSAITAVGAARRHLAKGAIRERSRQITKTLSIVHALIGALDHGKGGEIAWRLKGLYVYITERLIEANAKQIDAPLAEVEILLTTLREAWAPVVALAA